jgi:voltage-gated potassium channel
MTKGKIRPWTVLGRAIDRFVSDPSSVRNAALVMVVATGAIVVLGGFLVWLFDRSDYPDFPSALWYTLQTVTTVGYGDAVPTNPIGRIVGGIVMIVGVALIAIVTASITSTFIDAAQRARREGEDAEERDSTRAVHARLDRIDDRLAAMERSLTALAAERHANVPADATAPPPPAAGS